MSNKTVTVNEEQKLFVIPCGEGYSCLGFDVCEDRAVRLGSKLVNKFGYSVRAPEVKGTIARYNQYQEYVEFARVQNEKTRWQSSSELTPELVGFEHKRVEVVHQWPNQQPEKTRFIVGKSTGWIPCHLEIKTRRNISGGAVCLGKILSVRVVG